METPICPFCGAIDEDQCEHYVVSCEEPDLIDACLEYLGKDGADLWDQICEVVGDEYSPADFVRTFIEPCDEAYVESMPLDEDDPKAGTWTSVWTEDHDALKEHITELMTEEVERLRGGKADEEEEEEEENW
ncbi:hypothetical protein D6833_08930 [Candidatus Parcubacteria bacterium]|nr:MAG: hypothetical protein D6833_08930 [Candidatus Parcubacteria bacterium]